MVYADYDFYTDAYCGKTISADDWPALAMRASAYIDALTFGRLAAGAEIDDAARLAVCAVAEAERRAAAGPTDTVKSENVDGYSVTYEDATARGKRLNTDRLAAADLHLPRSHPLRYAGVM